MGNSLATAPDASRAPELLRAVLRSDVELAAFCQDHFPAVRARFTDQLDHGERIRMLLDTVPAPELVAHLREFAPNAPAWGPQRSVWPYVLIAITLLIALVGGFLAWRMTMGRRVAGVGGPRGPQRQARGDAESAPARLGPITSGTRRA